MVHRKADGICEKASVVLTQSCPASKVASSCPCCCHSNRKGLDVEEMGALFLKKKKKSNEADKLFS